MPLPEDEILKNRDFESPFEFLVEKTSQHRDRARTGHLDWARELNLGDGTFTFFHTLVPHEPYDYLPSGKRYMKHPIPRIRAGGTDEILVGEEAVPLAYQQALLQTAYVDQVIGEIRRTAKDQGVWKEMMLIVVGDHGANFRSGETRRVVQDETVGAIAFTPLFVKYPGSLKGGVSKKAPRVIDIMPTAAKSLGLDPGKTDGKPISELGRKPFPITLNHETHKFRIGKILRKAEIGFRDMLLGEEGDLFRIGPEAPVIGLRVSEPPPERPLARIGEPERYETVDLDHDEIPALIFGQTELQPGETIGVSLNGQIAGTGNVIDDEGINRFGAIVDPALLRPKGNRVELYLIEDGQVRERIG